VGPPDPLQQDFQAGIKRGLEMPWLKVRRRRREMFEVQRSSRQTPVGFDQPATKRFGAMLGFVDVNEAVAGPDTLGRKVSHP